MSSSELIDIVERAEESLRELGFNWSFATEAKALLAAAAAGFPWFVHVLGQRALLLAYEDDFTVVEGRHIRGAIAGIVTEDLAEHFSSAYDTAVRGLQKARNVYAIVRGLADNRCAPKGN